LAVVPVLGQRIDEAVKMAIELANQNDSKKRKKDIDAEEPAAPPAQLTTLNSSEEPSLAILNEIKNGYDMMFVGLEDALAHDIKTTGTLSSSIEQIIREFKGPLAIAVARDHIEPQFRVNSMSILVPTTGTGYSRLAAEVAIAIAEACGCGVTALNVSPPLDQTLFASKVQEHLRPGRAVLKDIKALGKRQGVIVKTLAEVRRTAEPAILSQIKKGKHNLLVLGANVRPGEGLFFGHSIIVLLQKTKCSLLIVSS
jgi:nucleotide-binding universal stress UspA family protein